METKIWTDQGKDRSGNFHITATKDNLYSSVVFTQCNDLDLQVNFDNVYASTNRKITNNQLTWKGEIHRIILVKSSKDIFCCIYFRGIIQK